MHRSSPGASPRVNMKQSAKLFTWQTAVRERLSQRLSACMPCHAPGPRPLQALRQLQSSQAWHFPTRSCKSPWITGVGVRGDSRPRYWSFMQLAYVDWINTRFWNNRFAESMFQWHRSTQFTVFECWAVQIHLHPHLHPFQLTMYRRSTWCVQAYSFHPAQCKGKAAATPESAVIGTNKPWAYSRGQSCHKHPVCMHANIYWPASCADWKSFVSIYGATFLVSFTPDADKDFITATSTISTQNSTKDCPFIA